MTTPAAKDAAVAALEAATPAVQATTDASLKLNHASVVTQAKALSVVPPSGESPDPTEGTQVVDEVGHVWTFNTQGLCLEDGVAVHGWASRPSAPLYYWKSRVLYCRGKSETTETWWQLDRKTGAATGVPDPRSSTPPPVGYDPKSYLTITDTASLNKRRSELIAAEWVGGLPTGKPNPITLGVPPPITSSAVRVDRWQTAFTYSASVFRTAPRDVAGHALTSVTVYCSGYCFRPKTPSKKAVILMPGHNGDMWARNYDLAARQLLDAGHTVVNHWMICWGENYASNGWNHDQFANLGGIVSPFVDHYLASGNQLLGEGFAVNLLGLSGGAWAALLCRAADPRLRRAWHVCGWQPLALWSEAPAVVGGDWEQTAGLGSLSYEDLAAMGNGVQANNDNDIYFPQVMPSGARKFELYQPEVDKRAKAVGGAFGVYKYITPTKDHTLTPELIQAFINDL